MNRGWEGGGKQGRRSLPTLTEMMMGATLVLDVTMQLIHNI